MNRGVFHYKNHIIIETWSKSFQLGTAGFQVLYSALGGAVEVG